MKRRNGQAPKQAIYDQTVGDLLSLFLILNMLNLFVKQVYSRTFLASNFSLIAGLVFLGFLVLQNKTLFVMLPKLIAAEVVAAVVVGYSLLMNGSVRSAILSRCIWLFIFDVPFVILFSAVSDKETAFHRTAIPAICVTVFAILRFALRPGSGREYNMAVGYALLYPLLIHTLETKKRIWFLPVVILEFSLVLIFGSRGAALCFLVFLFYLFVLSSSTNTVLQFIGKIGSLLAVALIIIFYDSIILRVTSLFSGLGFSSRTLSYYVANILDSDSGRINLWARMWRYVLEKPILGYGIAGELTIMGTYPHQVFIEMMMHFGLVAGGVIDCFILYRIIRTFLKTGIRNDCLWLMTCSGLLPLMFSSTYIQFPLFWVLLGITSGKKRVKILLGRH